MVLFDWSDWDISLLSLSEFFSLLFCLYKFSSTIFCTFLSEFAFFFSDEELFEELLFFSFILDATEFRLFKVAFKKLLINGTSLEFELLLF